MHSFAFKTTRRGFLKTSAVGVGALLLADRAIRSIVEELMRLGVPVPWYRAGQIKTTYNYCDICPWRCGIVVKSVNGLVYSQIFK